APIFLPHSSVNSAPLRLCASALKSPFRIPQSALLCYSPPMRRRWIIALLSVCILGALAIIASQGEREPRYKGHSLSWWMEHQPTGLLFHGPALSRTKMPGSEAVLAIGTNGLPFYLKWIQYRPSFCMMRVGDAVRKLPTRWQRTSVVQSIL